MFLFKGRYILNVYTFSIQVKQQSPKQIPETSNATSVDKYIKHDSLKPKNTQLHETYSEDVKSPQYIENTYSVSTSSDESISKSLDKPKSKTNDAVKVSSSHIQNEDNKNLIHDTYIHDTEQLHKNDEYNQKQIKPPLESDDGFNFKTPKESNDKKDSLTAFKLGKSKGEESNVSVSPDSKLQVSDTKKSTHTLDKLKTPDVYEYSSDTDIEVDKLPDEKTKKPVKEIHKNTLHKHINIKVNNI